MKVKIIKIFIVSMLIMLLTALDFVLLGYNIVLAVADNMGIATNVQNVNFDVYFDQKGSKVYEKQIDVSSEDTIILHIDVKNNGVLEDAKIKINNSNFKILKDKIQNTYVKEISEETNEIILNPITYGNSIDIEIPIQFKKQDIFDMSYFEQESVISISGVYRNDVEQSVSSERKLKINWTGDTDVILSQEVNRFVNLGEDGILIQQNVKSDVLDNKLPREQEILEVKVPVILGQKPNDIYVLLNGKKLSNDNVNYDSQSNLLEIKTINDEEQYTWGEGQNNYQIIYIYPSQIGEDSKQIDINTTLKTKLFTRDEIQKQDLQTIEISEIGNIVNIQKNALQQIYKGYLYANVQNEVTFEEEDSVNIIHSDSLENIQVEELESQFANDNNEEFVATNSVNYKGIVINKQNMIEMLGEQGNITIQDENNMVIATIDNSSEVNENGNIEVTYEGDKKNIKIITSKPITEGTITFKHIKTIKGESGYTKEQLKTFTKLISRSKVTTQLGEELGGTILILQDTKTEAKIEISNNSLSTLQTNENVQFLITLMSNNEQYDLYRNPTIEIILPKELTINVKNITQLNRQGELKIVNPRLINNQDGTNTISMQLQGEQLSFENNINGGIQVLITADITIDKTIPTMSSQIVMNYTNENRSGEQFNYQLPITLNSKYGVLMVNELSNYNSNGETLENIDDKAKEVTIDMNAAAREANQEISVINNYESDITDLALIGKFPESGEQKVNNEELKATFGTKLLRNIEATGETAHIYYSDDINATTDSDTWVDSVEDFSDIKAFKVEIEDNKLESGAVLNLSSQIEIPENLGYDQSSYIPLTLSYDYLGNKMTSYSNIVLKTEEGLDLSPEEKTEDTIGDLSVEVSAKTGGENIKDGQQVYEGQGIKYSVVLTNNGDTDINNIKLNATQTNAIFYDEIVYHDGWDSITNTTVDYTKIEENPELKEKVFELDVLKPGESKTFEYQFSVKEVEGENNVTVGNIVVNADGIEEKAIPTFENKINQAKLKVTLQTSLEEEYPVYSENKFPLYLYLYNISGEVQRDIEVEIKLPEGMSFNTDDLLYGNFVEYQNNVIKFEIDEIQPIESTDTEEQKMEKIGLIKLGVITPKVPIEDVEQNISLYYTANVGNETYVSNEVSRTIYQSESKITVTHTGSITNTDTVKDGDKLDFNIHVKNEGPLSKLINVSDSVPTGAVIDRAYVTTNGVASDIEIDENNFVYYNQELNKDEEFTITIETTISEEKAGSATILNEPVISVAGQTIICDSVEYKIEGREEVPDNPDEYNSIRGTVWVDENKNGMRDSNEERLSNIVVYLLDSETGKIVQEGTNEEKVTVTDFRGDYEFEDLPEGDYLVVFAYDTTAYTVTEYQKQGVSENSNSDVVIKNIELEGRQQQVAMTKNLQLSTEDLNYIDAGLVEASTFDMALNKYVNKVIVQDNTGTKVYSYSNEQLAKLELDAKRVNNSTVIIEYKIIVTNEGDTPGYINEVADYMPTDLDFSSEMNKNWYQGTDGNLYSKELSDQILNPGESKELILTLTKSMNQDNVGTVINTAEISQTNNDFNLNDIDSIPGNQKQGEDDISVAEVLISIRTGTAWMYTGLIIIIVAILAIGIYIINKKVLKEDNDIREDKF